MFWLVGKLYSFFFGSSPEETCNIDEENYLTEELLRLEIENSENLSSENYVAEPEVPLSDCFEKTGPVTFIDNEYGLVDGALYFEIDNTVFNIRCNDRIRYLAHRNSEGTTKIARVLQNLGPRWSEDDLEFNDEQNYDTLEHVIVAEVGERYERVVCLKNHDVTFDLDKVESTFIPVTGDWVELLCKVKWDQEKPAEIDKDSVLEVISVRPLRSCIKTCKVTHLFDEGGICDKQIYFDKKSLQNSLKLFVGLPVIVEAIESNQGSCIWRAIKLILDENAEHQKIIQNDYVDNEETNSFETEKKKNLLVTHPVDFKNVDLNSTASIQVIIENKSDCTYSLIKWKLMNSRNDSQVMIEPFLNKRMRIFPDVKASFNIKLHPKILGSSKELLVFVFDGFQVKRWININVTNNQVLLKPGNGIQQMRIDDAVKAMHSIRNSLHQNTVVGGKLMRTPNFVPVKLGMFPIPDKFWNAVLGDSDQMVYTKEYGKILSRIENYIPCVLSTLDISNYTDRWHALLYIEEIQQNLQMRSYDMPKTFLTPSQEFIGLEIKGLSERRPSLIKGDRVIVKDIWDSNKPKFEGFIHHIRGDTILMKFNPQFHELYNGYDVSIEFHFGRTVYRRCHQAINLSINHLGPEVLFPSRINVRKPRDIECFKSIRWFNKHLNPGQKTAIYNILQGVCRPLPYCIFGPPGTGKTITVTEAILQILSQLPYSRILVATPSNSAGNLLTERLLDYKDVFRGSMIRLIAHYLLESETLPEVIKPYCATLDIAAERTAKSLQDVTSNGINVNCRANFIGRHRVTIGTCACLGSLAQMALPAGHFTHVIVDEAGQATEPEIMIPLTFIDKNTGQVILAGDPLQLGPVVISKYAQEFGLDESFLARLLERFPYQKDYKTYTESGYDQRLITRLTFNYRSLPEVLSIPSELFYDNSLVPMLNRNEDWIENLLTNISDVLPNNKSEGGIYIFGMKGVNMRAEDSPSWYNPQEAAMLLLYACKLYKRNVHPDQIGIITPYIAQIKYLRKLFDSTGSPLPKIGTVEEFQGQERPIILMSTVRSTETLLEDDLKHTLGFVRNPKRLNVALTRAQVVAVIFCNPHLLSRDSLWRKVIQDVVVNNKYSGCDLPVCLQDEKSAED